MPVKLTPQEFQQKHARNLKASVEDIRAGVNRVTKAPGEAAAAKADKWFAAISSQDTKSKWARRVAAVTLEDWKDKMITKGVGRIAQGIDGAAAKVEDFAEKLIAHQNAGLPQIEKMPDLTLEDSISRSAAWIRHMSNFKR